MTTTRAMLGELIKALEEHAPDDPFIGQELSGGPACIGCESDLSNADHDGSTRSLRYCGWMRDRALLVRARAVFESSEEVQ